MSTLSVDTIQGKTTAGTVAMPAGAVLQVVQGSLGTRPTSASSSFVNTGLQVSITPKFSTSKVLITSSFLFSQTKSAASTQDNMKIFTFYRDSTNIAPHNSCFFQHQNSYATTIGANNAIFGETTENATMEFLDSPSTTSAITYSVQYKNDNPTELTLIFNCRGNGTGQAGSSVITAQEIAQ